MKTERAWEILGQDVEPEVKIYRLARELRAERSINESLWYAVLEMRDLRKKDFCFDEEPELPDYFKKEE